MICSIDDAGDAVGSGNRGVDPDGRMYLLDLWRRQASSDVWIEAEEKGQIHAGLGPFIDQSQRERQAWCYRRDFPVRADKAVRARSIQGRMALTSLYVPSSAPWYADLRSELLSFPAGKHDDQVDALGLIGQLLDTITEGTRPKPPEKAKPMSDYRTWDGDHGRIDDWKTY